MAEETAKVGPLIYTQTEEFAFPIDRNSRYLDRGSAWSHFQKL